MIILYTDFGMNGPYVGQLKAAILAVNPQAVIVDLMHDAPMFDIRHSAFLLGILYRYFPADGIFCCVVDPGVGSARDAIVIQAGKRFFVGPDNGLFEYILRAELVIKAYQINWQPAEMSNTFHGRDIFAPISAKLSNNNMSDLVEIKQDKLYRQDWPNKLEEIIYIDPYGNLTTGIPATSIGRHTCLKINNTKIQYARTYAEMPDDQPYWYINSNQLVEIAVNGSNAQQVLCACIGQHISII